MFARILSVMFIFVVSSTAHAVSLFETGLTYQWQESKLKNPQPFGESTAEMQGFGFFFRWAYRFHPHFFAGVDMHYHFPRYKDPAVSYNTSTSNFDVGPTIGGMLPWAGVYTWATYLPFGEIDPIGNSQLNYRFIHPQGWRVGLAVPVSTVALSLQYQQAKFKTTRFENAAQFGTSNTDGVRFDGGGWIIGVSFPYEM